MIIIKKHKYKALIYNKPEPKTSNLCVSIKIILIPPKTLSILMIGFFCSSRIFIGKVGVIKPFLNPARSDKILFNNILCLLKYPFMGVLIIILLLFLSNAISNVEFSNSPTAGTIIKNQAK